MRNYRNTTQEITVKGERNFGKSETVPDMAPSMREMLIRHANGITANVSQNLAFSGDLPDTRNVEPHDLAVMIKEQQQQVDQLKAQAESIAIQQRQAAYEQKRKQDQAYKDQLIKELKDK